MAKLKPHRVKGASRSLILVVTLLLAACASKEQQAQGYLDNGMRLLSGQSNQKAAIEFRNAVRLKKDMLPAWRGLAQAQEALEDWEGLLPVLKTILTLDSGDSQTRMKLAKFLVVANAPDQALTIIDEAPTGEARLLAIRALAHFRLNQRALSVQEAQSALKEDAGNPDALVVLATDRLADGDPRAALQLLQNEPADRPRDLQLETLKLSIYAALKDYPRLETLLKELASSHPREGIFSRQLVSLYLAQRRPDDAETTLRAIAATNPADSQVALEIVQLLYETRGPSAARAELDTLIKSHSDPARYQLAMANLEMNQGRIEEAVSLLNSLITSPVRERATEAKLALARISIGQKNVEEADKIIADILKGDARNVEALRIRASLRLQRDQIDAAIADLRQALSEQPHASDLMLLLASGYERLGSIDLAEKEFADALKDSKFNAEVGLSYVAFLKRRGRVDRSNIVLADLASRYPTNMQILSAFAEAKLSQQDWSGAQALAETITNLGNKAFADEIMGIALSYQRKYDASIAAFQSALDAAPSAAEPLVAMVGALVRAKRSDEAVKFLQSTLEKRPDNAMALVMLGEIAQSEGRSEQARDSFKAAIERQPKLDIGYRALSDFHRQQRQWDQALETARSGLVQLPDNPNLELLVASTLEAKGDYEAAIKEYEKLFQQQPGSLIIANNLASLLADHRNDKPSLERARSLAANLQDSDIVQFKETLGWVHSRLGDFRTAIPLLEAAATKLPALPVVRFHLGVTYINAGNVSGGADQLKLALTQGPDAALEARIRGELGKIVLQ